MAQIDKSKEDLIEEITLLNKRIANLESEHKQQQQQQLLLKNEEHKTLEGRTRMLSQAIESASDDIVLADLNGQVTYLNSSALKTFGYSLEESKKLHVTQFPQNPEVALNIIETMKTQDQWTGEVVFIRKNKELFLGEISVSYLKDDKSHAIGLMSISRDITERKKAEENIKRNESRLRKLVDILQHQTDTIQAFLDYALEQAIQLTASEIGYIYHYLEDRREFVLNTWSKNVMPECSVIDPQTCYELDKTGLWGEAVRQRRVIIDNDFKFAHPLKKGYPEGHVHLLKFMTVPIFNGEKIVGVIGLANKEADYDQDDVLQVSLLIDTVWKVTDRMKAEEELRHQARELKIFHDASFGREERVLELKKEVERLKKELGK